MRQKLLNVFLVCLLCLTSTAAALAQQTIKVTGKVIDSTNEGVPGVNVIKVERRETVQDSLFQGPKLTIRTAKTNNSQNWRRSRQIWSLFPNNFLQIVLYGSQQKSIFAPTYPQYP